MSILTSCENSYPNNIDSKTSFSSENFSDSTSNSTESVILNTDIATETLSKNLDIKEIMDLFGDLGAFNWEYLGYDSAWDRITSGDGTDGFRNENDRYFGKIVNADIATYSALIEKLINVLRTHRKIFLIGSAQMKTTIFMYKTGAQEGISDMISCV